MTGGRGHDAVDTCKGLGVHGHGHEGDTRTGMGAGSHEGTRTPGGGHGHGVTRGDTVGTRRDKDGHRGVDVEGRGHQRGLGHGERTLGTLSCRHRHGDTGMGTPTLPGDTAAESPLSHPALGSPHTRGFPVLPGGVCEHTREGVPVCPRACPPPLGSPGCSASAGGMLSTPRKERGSGRGQGVLTWGCCPPAPPGPATPWQGDTGQPDPPVPLPHTRQGGRSAGESGGCGWEGEGGQEMPRWDPQELPSPGTAAAGWAPDWAALVCTGRGHRWEWGVLIPVSPQAAAAGEGPWGSPRPRSCCCCCCCCTP